jgi:hypothetical protein
LWVVVARQVLVQVEVHKVITVRLPAKLQSRAAQVVQVKVAHTAHQAVGLEADRVEHPADEVVQ